ncbi:hypothetical protein CKALI_04360 [Corynebacterium kalinowskii]|uniref:Uncharacterized protein n=1 Tax=Corynebacterium kalinowskii TaxID=2675216 RepID=A0A6B8VPL3_9CORY|nr:hypothetical protein [Corynebacterium kalinowskii]QGU01751.1 hypothetical protein CKALI_04360 [Corynebacterium kalinowskii]
MKKSTSFFAASVVAATLLTGCTGTNESGNAPQTSDMKDSRASKSDGKGPKVEDSEMYLDGQLVRLIGGANPDDWSVEMTAAESVELVKKYQEEYRANPSTPTAIHVTIDGTSTEFLFTDPAIDLAGPWEKFAKESVKLKDLPETVHHFKGQDSSIENDISSLSAQVPVDQCVKNIQDMAATIGKLDPALDKEYSANIGAKSCGEKEAHVIFDISRPQAELAKDLAAVYGETNGPETFEEVYFDGATGELSVTAFEGQSDDDSKFREVMDKYPELAQ